MSMLFNSSQLGGVELPNRLAISPMCQYSAVDGIAQPWHFSHIGAMGISGAGLVIMEATGVEPVGRITPGCLGLYNDAQELALAKLLASVRSFSSAAFGIQLGHAGRKASTPVGWDAQDQIPVDQGGWETVGPSPLAFGPGWRAPTELDEAGLQRVRDAFVQAAMRADRIGFDVLEIHAAHGYLLNSFLSPLANLRSDRYGGSPERRMTFPLEVMSAIRVVWPRGKGLGIRLNGTELDERGLNIEDAIDFVRELKPIGIDYVTMSAGNAVPGRTYPPLVPGYQVEYAEKVRTATGVPTMAVGMILFPDQAEDILASRQADFIAIGRGYLDDPRWGWHAAEALGAKDVYPPQHRRVRPERWPGYKLVHDRQDGASAANNVYRRV